MAEVRHQEEQKRLEAAKSEDIGPTPEEVAKAAAEVGRINQARKREEQRKRHAQGRRTWY